MIYQHDERQDTNQLHARQVGEAAPKHPYARERDARSGSEIDQQVERVRWLMRREPMLEREMQQM